MDLGSPFVSAWRCTASESNEHTNSRSKWQRFASTNRGRTRTGSRYPSRTSPVTSTSAPSSSGHRTLSTLRGAIFVSSTLRWSLRIHLCVRNHSFHPWFDHSGSYWSRTSGFGHWFRQITRTLHNTHGSLHPLVDYTHNIVHSFAVAIRYSQYIKPIENIQYPVRTRSTVYLAVDWLCTVHDWLGQWIRSVQIWWRYRRTNDLFLPSLDHPIEYIDWTNGSSDTVACLDHWPVEYEDCHRWESIESLRLEFSKSVLFLPFSIDYEWASMAREGGSRTSLSRRSTTHRLLISDLWISSAIHHQHWHVHGISLLGCRTSRTFIRQFSAHPSNRTIYLLGNHLRDAYTSLCYLSNQTTSSAFRTCPWREVLGRSSFNQLWAMKCHLFRFDSKARLCCLVLFCLCVCHRQTFLSSSASVVNVNIILCIDILYSFIAVVFG